MLRVHSGMGKDASQASASIWTESDPTATGAPLVVAKAALPESWMPAWRSLWIGKYDMTFSRC